MAVLCKCTHFLLYGCGFDLTFSEALQCILFLNETCCLLLTGRRRQELRVNRWEFRV